MMTGIFAAGFLDSGFLGSGVFVGSQCVTGGVFRCEFLVASQFAAGDDVFVWSSFIDLVLLVRGRGFAIGFLIAAASGSATTRIS
jgi:hypothetical protein